MGHPWKHTTDLTGQRFGRLLVQFEMPRRGQRGTREYWRRWWRCVCDCGNECTIKMDELRNSDTRSCGCLQRELLGNQRRIHGRTQTTEYNIWASMKQRCINPRSQHYTDYGGRGIKVCDKWMVRFADFYADMGPRPSVLHSIDRRDNNGDYTPDNCRWATKAEQARNMRERIGDAHVFTHNGRTQTLLAWSRELGVKKHTLYTRLRNGWPIHQALSP